VTILQTHRLAAGYLYQAHLRAALSHSPGAAWTPTRTGQAELATVPAGVVAAFSQRRAQLVERLERTGGAGWHAVQAAAVITRAPKEPLDLTRLTSERRARAAEHRLDRAALDRVLFSRQLVMRLIADGDLGAELVVDVISGQTRSSTSSCASSSRAAGPLPTPTQSAASCEPDSRTAARLGSTCS